MKKILTIVTGVMLVAQAAFSQGTVNFANTGSFTTARDRNVLNVDGSRLVGVNYVAALYWGRQGAPIDQLAVRAVADETLARATVAFRNVAPDTTAAGTWVGGIRTLLGTATGDLLTLQIRVWDVSQFATYADAVGRGITGQSTPFEYRVAASSDASGLKIDNMVGFQLVPEPSTIALAVLGLGSLLLFRRRK